MSYSTIYQVFRTKSSPICEYRNAWGTGPAIWNYLSKKYLGLDGWSPFLEGDGGLWALARDERVPLALRACHAITFDYALTPRDKLKEMGALVAEGGRMIEDGAHVNHFAAIGSHLAELKLDRRAKGVGLNCTSVSDTWGQEAKYWREPWDCYAYITGDSP